MWGVKCQPMPGPSPARSQLKGPVDEVGLHTICTTGTLTCLGYGREERGEKVLEVEVPCT
jgi:hypothetical protein